MDWVRLTALVGGISLPRDGLSIQPKAWLQPANGLLQCSVAGTEYNKSGIRLDQLGLKGCSVAVIRSSPLPGNYNTSHCISEQIRGLQQVPKKNQ